MHYFVFPSADAWISSGSSKLTGETFQDQNFGQDQILEVKKEFNNESFFYKTRALVNFAGTSFNEMSNSIANGDIENPKFYLRLFASTGNSDTSGEYKLSALAISQSWDEGTGKFGDRPKTKSGVSWLNRSYPVSGNEVSWSTGLGISNYGVSTIEHNVNEEEAEAVQSFAYESGDIEMDISSIASNWISGSSPGNHGVLIRISGSQETDETTLAALKFFSRNTHTIYAPRLELRWDGHKPITGSNTGSLSRLDLSGNTDNHIYTIGLKDSYRDTDKIKFRIGARKQYVQKTFSTSVQRVSGSYIPEGSGSYAIVDVATGEKVIDFSSYSKLSCDSKSNYFIEYLNGFYPDRYYKILIKLLYEDGQEIIYDDDFEFKIVR